MNSDKTRKTFRYIFITQPSHDFSPLVPLAQELKFATNGYGDLNQSIEQIEEALSDFDPSQDALVVTGRVNVAFLMGRFLASRWRTEPFWIGIYHRPENTPEGNYEWRQV